MSQRAPEEGPGENAAADDVAAADESTSTADQAPPPAAATPAPPGRPMYKGEPLEAERGPGLGCFWLQIVLLVVLLIATPLSVILAFPSWFSAALLIATLGILFFVGQTTIFLLRLVAADRRAQRRPLREGARKTVGQIEAEAERSSDEDDAGPR